MFSATFNSAPQPKPLAKGKDKALPLLIVPNKIKHLQDRYNSAAYNPDST